MAVVAGEGGTAEVRMVLSSLPETIRLPFRESAT